MLKKYFTELRQLLEESILSCSADCISFSGGLDSTIIAYYLKEKNPSAISIITEDFLATDLTYCQLAAKEFDLRLKIENVGTSELLSAVANTIKILKNFNDIEIRNSVVIYLIIEKIKKMGYTSIITGDGADELFAGYSFFLKKTQKELEDDLNRIWKIMHFPSQILGQEMNVKVESPFLSEKILKFAKDVPVDLKVRAENGKKYGKWILRKAFENKIPKSIVWRDKAAMQDGSGTSGLTSLFASLIPDGIFQEKIKQIQESDGVTIRSKESLHYYETYRKSYAPPLDLHSSDHRCPYCQFFVEQNSKFCRMCGSFPI